MYVDTEGLDPRHRYEAPHVLYSMRKRLPSLLESFSLELEFEDFEEEDELLL